MAVPDWEVARFEISGATALFTGREGGCSAPPWDSFNLGDHVGDEQESVEGNRLAVIRETGIVALLGMEQVHGTEVVFVGAPPPGRAGFVKAPGCDGLATDVRNLGLMALAADCVPIAIAGPGIVGVVHAGWRGIAAGVVDNAVGSLVARSTGPLEAAIGPSARGCCYEVSADVLAALGLDDPRGRALIDLQQQVAKRLEDLRVAVVGRVERCTICDPALFSHRAGGPRTGRQGVIAWLNS